MSARSRLYFTCLYVLQAFAGYLPRLGSVVFENALVVQGNRQACKFILCLSQCFPAVFFTCGLTLPPDFASCKPIIHATGVKIVLPVAQLAQ